MPEILVRPPKVVVSAISPVSIDIFVDPWSSLEVTPQQLKQMEKELLKGPKTPSEMPREVQQWRQLVKEFLSFAFLNRPICIITAEDYHFDLPNDLPGGRKISIYPRKYLFWIRCTNLVWYRTAWTPELLDRVVTSQEFDWPWGITLASLGEEDDEKLRELLLALGLPLSDICQEIKEELMVFPADGDQICWFNHHIPRSEIASKLEEITQSLGWELDTEALSHPRVRLTSPSSVFIEIFADGLSSVDEKARWKRVLREFLTYAFINRPLYVITAGEPCDFPEDVPGARKISIYPIKYLFFLMRQTYKVWYTVSSEEEVLSKVVSSQEIERPWGIILASLGEEDDEKLRELLLVIYNTASPEIPDKTRQELMAFPWDSHRVWWFNPHIPRSEIVSKLKEIIQSVGWELYAGGMRE